MSYDDAGLAYFLDSCCEHWSETVTADRKGMIAVRDKLASLTAEVERLREALLNILRGDGKYSIEREYGYVRDIARAALAPQQQADATGGEVDERDVRAAAAPEVSEAMVEAVMRARRPLADHDLIPYAKEKYPDIYEREAWGIRRDLSAALSAAPAPAAPTVTEAEIENAVRGAMNALPMGTFGQIIDHAVRALVLDNARLRAALAAAGKGKA